MLARRLDYTRVHLQCLSFPRTLLALHSKGVYNALPCHQAVLGESLSTEDRATLGRCMDAPWACVPGKRRSGYGNPRSYASRR
jgi:hypothetical protein